MQTCINLFKGIEDPRISNATCHDMLMIGLLTIICRVRNVPTWTSWAMRRMIPSGGLLGLDGFYLFQERLYRKLYDHVREQKEEEIDFSMDTMPHKERKGTTWIMATISRTLLALYGILCIISLFLFIAIQCFS